MSEPWIPAGDCSSRTAPYRSGGNTHQDILRSWIFAASVVAACGVLLFGVAALQVLAVAVLSAVLGDWAVSIATRRPVIGGLSHACLTGLLLGLMLPATVRWFVPMFGALVAVILAKGLFGGLGHYVWQPAVVGRVVVQFLFNGQLSLSTTLAISPVLAPGHLLVGDLDLDRARAVNLGTYRGWSAADEPVVTEAWKMERPVQALRRFADGKLPSDAEVLEDRPLRFEPLLRDALPPWTDTLFGTVPGGIGETCSLALIVAGLYLMYRGYLRWQLPVAILGSAALAAAILPIETSGPAGGYLWLPLLEVEQSVSQARAVGLAYVMYHLTAGQLMLGAFLLSGDMIALPLRARGQLLFGAGVGILTIFMRLYGHLEGECYWAILIMNWLVSPIDRWTRRPILGLAPA